VTERVVVMGQGYVGLPVALRAVEVGCHVVGYEPDVARATSLAAGHSYVGDIDDATLATALASGRYLPTADAAHLAGFDVAVISVPTPLRDGRPDLSMIESAGATLAPHLRPGVTVILESTTYPGTTTELLGPVLEAGSGLAAGADFHLGYSPERIDPGNAQWDLVRTPKVVSGIDDASLAAVQRFFDRLVERTVPVANTAEAELTKLLENTFRHVNIALVNELAMFARELGVDIWNVVDAAATKPFGFMSFRPGPGVGGHCLPVDPSYLSWRVRETLDRDFRFVELANDVNEGMPAHVGHRVEALLQRNDVAIDGADVLLLGLAYKRATSDWRESPTVPLAEWLVHRGARIRVVDPYVPPVNAAAFPHTLVPWSTDELATADIVVLLVDHPEFDPATIAGHSRLVFDAKGLLRGRPFRGEVL
jgi:UDP-N-acetyl-D-mannosaminuronic acid dehydrogenase/UDP-N-acetyl-D-glucosamine dehydrogenase